MQPNVLLIVLDAARRDAVAPYSADPRATPAIADLARRGAALPHAYANSSWTLPSHAAMFTGRLPRALGLSQPPDGSTASVRPVLAGHEPRWLPSVLRRGGYRTEGFSANLWISPHAGFDLGFDRFHYLTGGREERINQLLAGGWRGRCAWALEGLRSRADDGADALGRELRASIANRSGKPSFWFVNLVECHSPYLPPRPWNDLGPSGRMRAALEAQRHLNFLAICLYVAGRAAIPQEALDRMRHLYARAIAYMDDWLALVLEALDRHGILEQTLVIVTSDHGENFGEGGLIVHGFSVDERLIRVPLVAAGPGASGLAEQGGHGAFSLAELPRAIAQAIDLADHPWVEDPHPAGVAVAEYDPMGGPQDAKVREFAAKWALDEAGIRRLSTGYAAATDGRRKLVSPSDGGERRYDLDSDPLESDPLPDDPAFAPLRAALDQALDAGPAARTESRPAVGDEELAALERQMRLLGYL